MKKSLIISFICGVLLLSGVAYAQSASFTDWNSFSDWYRNDVNYLKRMGVITGYDDGSFRPANNVTRAELGVMLKRSMDTQLYPSDMFAIMEKYEDLLELGVPEYYAKSLAVAASGFYLSEEVPEQISVYNCDDVVELDISSSYTVYDCGYSHIIHVKNDSFDRPFGAVDNSIDKWFESEITSRDFAVPSLFREE